MSQIRFAGPIAAMGAALLLLSAAVPALAGPPAKPAKVAKTAAKPAKKAAAAPMMFECSKCHMKVTAAVAKKDHLKDPMDGGTLNPVKSGKTAAPVIGKKELVM